MSCRLVNGWVTMGRNQVRPSMLRASGPWSSAAVVVTAVSSGTSAGDRVIVNPYWAGGDGGPAGDVVGSDETGETAAEVIATGVPVWAKHSPLFTGTLA